ncbi:hypothetical protein JZ751_011549 [Albula glossodonta]|uniref:Cytochrome b5 heme-binding domain-containing protein n=1 Tax=Albula glossodonta TaxID=121402 RepID=A0A8T2N208_9TELE|nr:hypothetical protein JZ751_011549 [Albula glossodonta]
MPAEGKASLRQFTWHEIQEKGGGREKFWLVIDRRVYDITSFRWRHPGGSRIIAHYAGQDATDAFTAFHIEPQFVSRFLRPLLIGELQPQEPSQELSKNDFAHAVYVHFYLLLLLSLILLLPLFLLLLLLPPLSLLLLLFLLLPLPLLLPCSCFCPYSCSCSSPVPAPAPDPTPLLSLPLLLLLLLPHPIPAPATAPAPSPVPASAPRSLVDDFRQLRGVVESMGLLRPWRLFFVGALLHILALDLAAWLTLWLCGSGWGPFLISALLLATVQAQAGWLQHDFGHLSVFGTSKWNHLVHHFVIGHLKGAPASWWNHLHFQHHAKPNCYRKDPDVNLHPLPFTLGTNLSIELGTLKKKFMPYQYQHKYFFILGPPALIPLYFQWYIFYFVVKRHKWQDLAWMMSFYVRFILCYLPLLGLPSVISLFFLVRFLESNWFVWVTQMNHIPMHIDRDQNKDWVTMQQSLFNDWFTGHLNFQIEHHLFPTMPRHNYHAVAPLVRSLCEKHGLSYQSKSLFNAFRDIVRSLKTSGQLWMDAYLHK